ncbi:MAG: hypothetical protein JSR71_13730 [Proteobacteria bacterium]|nr:hypothetical protein [Pseudomonadota bacterium]
MDMNSISSTSSIYSNQYVSGQKRVDCDGGGQGSGKSVHAGHHHGGGGFMANVMQTLQAMGVNLPGPPSSSSTTPAASVDTGSSTTATSTATSANDPRQALHQLMHDLGQALRGMDSQQTSSTSTTDTTTDSDGDNDNSGSTQAVGQNNGYNSFDTKLQSLITMISNGSSSSSSGGGNDAISKLQTDFSNLMEALNQSSSSTSTNSTGTTAGTGATNTAPTLKDFLTTLEKNVSSHMSNQASTGALFNTTA